MDEKEEREEERARKKSCCQHNFARETGNGEDLALEGMRGQSFGFGPAGASICEASGAQILGLTRKLL